jgi:hypothetical protein
MMVRSLKWQGNHKLKAPFSPHVTCRLATFINGSMLQANTNNFFIGDLEKTRTAESACATQKLKACKSARRRDALYTSERHAIARGWGEAKCEKVHTLVHLEREREERRIKEQEALAERQKNKE